MFPIPNALKQSVTFTAELHDHDLVLLNIKLLSCKIKEKL